MIYDSVNFLFFVAFSLVLYSFILVQWRVPFLLMMSFLWYLSWNAYWALSIFGIIAFNYLVLKHIRSLKDKERYFYCLIILDVIIFFLLKKGNIGTFHFSTPYGTSFFMFILLGMVVSRLRGNPDLPMERFDHFLLMPTFFPLLVAGPIIRPREFIPQLQKGPSLNLMNIIDGVFIFSYGYLKRYLFADHFAEISKQLLSYVGNYPLLFILIGFLGTLQSYIDFSSFCDMGRGVARCFGIELLPNFRPFYFAKNPNDFWQRWNITLGEWIRDHISFPMMLRWGRKLNQNLILILSFIIVGLWHGITINWCLFGLYNGLIIVLYNWVNKKISIKGLGYFFAALIFVGNGILQINDLFGHLEMITLNIMEGKSLWMSHQEIGSQVNSLFTGRLILSLSLLFAVEVVQEKRKDLDWFIKIPTLIKSILVSGFMIWILWRLNSNELFENVSLIPMYFKI